jgi:large subunit ribosomal protein L6
MSRIGKMPIKVPEKVKVEINGQLVKVIGPLGALEQKIDSSIKVVLTDGVIDLKCMDETDQTRARHGLTRSLVSNMVLGVSTGFKKELDIKGVGYRAEVKGQSLNLTLGFSHPVEFPLPKGIKAQVEKQTHLVISGASKELVGRTAASIRGYRPVEPYKGKGVRYTNEHVIKKVGKSAVGGGGVGK